MKVLSLLIVCLTGGLPGLSLAETVVEVFSDNPPVMVPQINGVNIYVYNLSTLDALNKNPPTFFGESVEQAQRLAQSWIDSPEIDAYEEKVRQAAVPLERMTQLQLSKVPAVVFDGEFVVYGTDDVTKAWGDFVRYEN